MKFIAISFILVTLVFRTVFGAEPTIPATHPLEQEMLAGLAAGRESASGRLGAALIASGIRDRPALEKLLARWETIAAPLLAVPAGTPRARARLLLEHLHTTTLRRYREERTSITDVFGNGDYNCVTSAVLYLELLRQAGFDARAVLIPEHVYAEVLIDDRWLEVETTNPRGFDPYRLRPAGAFEPHRFLIPDQAPGKPRIRLPARQLPGLLYYNRGTLAMKRKDYREALELLRFARLILPDHRESTENLLAAFLARGEELSRTGTLEAALETIRLGEQTLGPRPEFTELTIHANRVAAQAALKAGRHPEALRLLEKLLAEFPDPDGQSAAQLRACYADLAESLFRAARYREMRAALENGSGTTEPPDYRRFRISLMTRAAEMLVKSATPETGLSFFNETFPEDRGESQVGESRVYLIVRLAEEWKNRRAYQAAYLASRDGLLRYPDNRLLQAAKTAIVHEWATSLAPQDAGATLTALAARHAEPVFLTALVRNVLLEADRLQRANRREEAIRLLEGLLENTALPAAETKTVRGMLSTALHNRAVELIRAGLYDEAILFLESARRTFPDDRDLATLLAGAFHNHGLSLLQAGQNSLARNVVARGLEIFPDDRALLRLQKSLQSD